MFNSLSPHIKSLADNAINDLKHFAPAEGYFLAFSGGKDSVVCYDLLLRSGVPFTSHYSSTTIDPPDLLRFIKINYPNVLWHYAQYMGKPTNFYKLVERKGLPLRTVRWCCRIFKEQIGYGYFMIDGVRAAESVNRSKRQKFEYFLNKWYHHKYKNVNVDIETLEILVSKLKAKKILHIIFDWSDSDVWEYIKSLSVPYCELYNHGYKRIGCVGCPMAPRSKIIKEFNDYPIIKENYLKAIQAGITSHNYYSNFASPADVLEWYISKKSVSKYFADKQQIKFPF